METLVSDIAHDMICALGVSTGLIAGLLIVVILRR